MTDKVPATISDPEAGFLHIGVDNEDLRTPRRKHVQLAGGSGSSLRIFEDGGWELRAVSNKTGSNLITQGEGPLNIYSDGDININCGGKFSVKADSITMETTSADDGIVMNSKKNIRLDADNNLVLIGTNVTTTASQTLLAHSTGWHILSGSPVVIFEKKTKLIPTGLNDLVESLLNNIVLGV